MKKRLLAMAVAAAITLSVGSAFAAPVQLDGSASYQWRENTEDGARDTDGGIFIFKINALMNVDKHFDLYARFAAEGLSGKNNDGTALGSDLADPNKSFDAAIDQYGFIYKNAGVDYKLGRQGVTVGSTALLYNHAGKIGNHIFADGVTITGTAGATNLQAMAVQEDDIDSNHNKLYALSASYNPAKDWTIGGIVAKYKTDADTTNHWAVNTAYSFGNTTAFGEYTKSDADMLDTAYAVGVKYAIDKKNSISVTNFKVELNGDIGKQTDFDNNMKGFSYSYIHQFTKDTGLDITFQDKEYISGANDGKGVTSFRTTVNYSF